MGGIPVTNVRALLLVGVLAVATGCAGFYVAPVIPPPGFLYAKLSAPIDTDANPTKRGKKIGRAFTESFAGLFARGDASVYAAARNGGIRTIREIDYEFENYLGLYSKFTVVVYGE